ncbi:hypothetical protein EJ06DRAFT_584710 [Trichodelitschia bisporula]|uniref:ER membrane protein complex subunit 7 beta-sandwich domain-containing protein n=1 Tax=Trichodelitschia bisporula TaxID=703511 RepID=A0A6G1HME4_9PEZI|nr:hypothetical protein EJ06DRAFT_584710 [Trichodelitschia bisporula]
MRLSTLLLAPAALAAHLTIQPTPLPATVPPSTHATLLGPSSYTAPLTRTGFFVFANVSSGSYLLTLHSRAFTAETIRIDVGPPSADARGLQRVEAWAVGLGREWEAKGAGRGAGDGYARVEVKTGGPRVVFAERQSFSVLSLFKNPMIIMAVVSLGLVVGTPYLLENMDPESRAEFEEMQRKSPLAAATNPSALQNFDLASWMAGKTDEPAAAAPAPKQIGGGKQGKKRA